jgi:hypothetical protein
MVRFHAALGMTWKQRAHPCVSTREAYPRRIEPITHSKGGIDDWMCVRRLTREGPAKASAEIDVAAEALNGPAKPFRRL